MDPINYNIDVKTPFESAAQGYQLGAAMQQQQAVQAAQQQQLALQKQMQQDFANLANNKNATAQDYSSMMTKYPQLAEHFQKAWGVLNEEQQQNQLAQASKVYAALQSGNPDIAEQLLREQSTAKANAGDQKGAKDAEAMAQMVKIHPEFVKANTALALSAVTGKDKFATTYGTFGDQQRAAEMQPAVVGKAKAEATIKGVEAANAADSAALDLEKKQQEIEASKLKGQIDAIDVQIKQADSETKRGELQLQRDKLANELAVKQQAKTEDAQTHADTLTQAIETTNKLLKDEILDSPIGIGSAIGKVLSWIPGTANKDYRAQIDTLKAQLFLPAVQQLKAAGGAGALSDAEGKKLDAAVASLDADQSPKAFKANLGVVLNLLQKHQSRLVAAGNLPTNKGAGAFVERNPKYGVITESDINAAMRKFPGATRENVLDYLRSVGSK